MAIKKYKIQLLAVILLFVFFTSQGQIKDSLDNRSKRLLQYLDINMNDEKSMLKISPQYRLSDKYNFMVVSLEYEVKLNQSFTFIVSNGSQLTDVKDLGFSYGSYSGRLNYFFNSTGFSFRYYYLMNRKIREGISGNNLNGLYAEMGFSGLINILHYFSSSNTYNNTVEGRSLIDLPDPHLSFGLQKRINKWAFIDVFVSSSYNRQWEFFHSGVGFKIGLAF